LFYLVVSVGLFAKSASRPVYDQNPIGAGGAAGRAVGVVWITHVPGCCLAQAVNAPDEPADNACPQRGAARRTFRHDPRWGVAAGRAAWDPLTFDEA